MKKFARTVILFSCLLFSVWMEASAQPPPPPTPLGGGLGTGAPIDNEVVLLLIAAAALGTWKIRTRKSILDTK